MKSAADQQSKKKLIIKPFKSQPKIPENFELISWQKLQQAIHGVFHKISIDVSKEELYRVCAFVPFPSISSMISWNFRLLKICVSINLHQGSMTSYQQKFKQTLIRKWIAF
jgi:hypothetical protein